MNMQDNELDDLFRSRLGNMEIEPSAHLWDNIAAELGAPKKRSLAPLWSIAASVLIVLGAGSWFLIIKPVRVEKNQFAVRNLKPVVKSTESKVALEAEQLAVQQQATVIKPNLQHKEYIVTTKHLAKTQVNLVKDEKPVTEPVVKPLPEQSEQVLAAIPAQTIMHPVVPEMTLSVKADENDAVTTKPLSQPTVEPVMAHQAEKKRKRGIHTLGGLINAVIAKVDKREDKLIEFTETDEDQANITGINLGIIKIKKEK